MTTAKPAGDEADQSPGGDGATRPADASDNPAPPESAVGGVVPSPDRRERAEDDSAPSDVEHNHLRPEPVEEAVASPDPAKERDGEVASGADDSDVRSEPAAGGAVPSSDLGEEGDGLGIGDARRGAGPEAGPEPVGGEGA